MLSYLRGQVIGVRSRGGRGERPALILDVNQVGYEVQIGPRFAQSLVPGETVQVFTHLQWRDDQVVLYGFPSQPERDLFRQLLRVNGVGPQLALALLDHLGLADLVQGIVTGNVRLLSQTPGVGSKTAQRLALELKTQLAEWGQGLGVETQASGIPIGIQEDVEMTLAALGYSPSEIARALAALGREPSLTPDTEADHWIRQAIAYLSREV